MSGKGKQNSKKAIKPIKESGKLLRTSAANSDTSSEGSEMMTTLPVLKIIDNSTVLPRYTALLQRGPDDGINMEDLDILQLELEILLTSAVVRSRILQEEIANLSSAEERRDKRSKSGKGISLIDKKWKDDKAKHKEIGFKSQSPLSAKILKQRAAGSSSNQTIPPNPHENVRVEASKSDSQSKLLLPKNDTLNKFWASVDPYCADIMPEDIKFLEDLIANYGDLKEFKTIPPLGEHYSLKWANNDLLHEEEAGNPKEHKKKNKSDLTHMLPKVEKKTNGVAGPLTQRLVSAFIEENVFVANNNAEKLFRENEPVLRDMTIQNSMNLEARMRKELIEQGFLDPEPIKNEEDDEILEEIKRCQQELAALTSHNQAELKRLLHLAKEESKRQALKRKIASVDSEIVEQYQKLLATKQRKVPFPKEEQDKSWAFLKERENLLQQLNMLPCNSLGEPVVNTSQQES